AQLRSCEAGGEQSYRSAFDITFAAGNLAGEADVRHRLEAQLAVQQARGIDEAVAVDPSQPREFGIFEARDGAEDADLLAVFQLVERAVDVVLAAFVPAGGHPRDVHVDAVAVDDRRDRVEEGEGAFAGLGGDGFGQLRACQRTGGDDGGVVGQRIDAFTHDG